MEREHPAVFTGQGAFDLQLYSPLSLGTCLLICTFECLKPAAYSPGISQSHLRAEPWHQFAAVIPDRNSKTFQICQRGRSGWLFTQIRHKEALTCTDAEDFEFVPLYGCEICSDLGFSEIAENVSFLCTRQTHV